MEITQLITQFGTQGIFCGLFIFTYVNNINTNREREEKYIQTINSFSDSIDELKEVISNMNK